MAYGGDPDLDAPLPTDEPAGGDADADSGSASDFTPVDDSDAASATAERLACVDVATGHETIHPICREHVQQVEVAAPGDDEAPRYPRYLVFDNDDRLKLWQFGGRPVNFTDGHWQEYLDSLGRDPPVIRDATTWGPVREMDIEIGTVSARRLTRGGACWPWRVYGLDLAAQPNWEQYLQRTLAIFPTEHLQTTEVHTIVLDFKLGTSRMGPGAQVGSGGINWQRGGPCDPTEAPALGATYAALNRGWLRDRPADDATIDAWYSAANYSSEHHRVLGTLYHEHGHLYHPAEVGRNRNLWWQFFWALEHVGLYGGGSWDWGEGFSEAYRYRLMGLDAPRRSGRGAVTFSAAVRSALISSKSQIRDDETRTAAVRDKARRQVTALQGLPINDRNLGEQVDETLDTFDWMPSLESVRAVQDEIAGES